MLRGYVRPLLFPLIVAACGDSGGSSASNGATDGGTAAETGGASDTDTTAGSASQSASETEPTGGSDSQASLTGTTEPTPTTAVDSDSSSGPSSVSDPRPDTSTGPVSASEGDTSTGSSTTDAGDTGDTGTSGGSEGTGTSTGSGEPLACADVPPGFPDVDNPDCAVAPQVGLFNPVVEWSKQSWTVAPMYNQVMSTPIVVSLNDDNLDGEIDGEDTPDIVFNTFAGADSGGAGWLRAVSGKDGAELLNIGNQNINGTAGIAGGDIDGDGIVELVTVTSSGSVKAFEHDGTLKWATPVLNVSKYQYPAIADMNADGTPEVIFGRAILNADGSLRGNAAHGVGRSASVVADLDDDGDQELIGGNAIYDVDAKTLWFNNLLDGWVAVADVDQDGKLDVVVTEVDSGRVRLQDHTGAVKWDVMFPGGGGGPPTIADYDGDGAPEIGIAGKTGYAVFEGDGAVRWQKPTQDASSMQTGSSVYDFEGDGAADVIYNDEVRLRVYAGVDGTEKLNILGHGSATLWEYPIVVDVDNDGQSEIVVTNNNYVYGTRTGVTVYGDMNGSWRPGRKIWNQHAYSITNINDDGSIPQIPAQNYKTYNNFRSGDTSPPDGSKTPDVTLEVPEPCTFECGDGKLSVWVHPGNVGASPVTSGTTIEVIGLVQGQPMKLGEVVVPDDIAAGYFLDAVKFEVDAAGLESITVKVSIGEAECNQNNNEAVVPGPFCG